MNFIPLKSLENRVILGIKFRDDRLQVPLQRVVLNDKTPGFRPLTPLKLISAIFKSFRVAIFQSN